ncbi:MAG: GtrA family protein [Clostridium sp.]
MNKEVIKYLLAGILTTILNIFIFYMFNRISSYQIANSIAFIISIIFAYIVNKIYVFNSRSWEFKILTKEFYIFFLSRVGTYILDILFMLFLIEKINIKQLFSKILTNIVIIMLNYIMSKYIFKKN